MLRMAKIIIVVFLVIAYSLTSFSQDEGKKEEAKKHFELGKTYYKQSEYAKAIEEFQKAYSIYSHSVILYNIAQAYEKEGNIPMALRFFREYLRASPNAEDRNTILISIQNLEKKLQERGIQQVGIYSTPSEAEVAVNGKFIGKTPFAVELKPGKYILSLTKKGYIPIDKEFVVSPDKSLELDFTLNEMNIEGSKAVREEKKPIVSQPIKKEEAKSIKIPESPVKVEKDVKKGQKRMWTYIVGGTGGLLIGTGAVFGILSNSAESSLKSNDNLDRDQNEVQNLADKAQNYAMLANVFYGAGAAGLISATVLFFVEGKEPDKKNDKSVGITPYKDGFIFSYSGAF